MKKEKSRYAYDFLLGVGQPKDLLDTSRGRQLGLERGKGELLSSLSHNIKIPLNTIQLRARAPEGHLYTDEAQNVHATHQIQEKGKETKYYVEEIMKQSRHDILDVQVRNNEFYLKELIDKAIHVYKEPL